MSSFWQDILRAVLVALILGGLALSKQTYDELVELRHDVDALYSLVDDATRE